MCRGQDRAETPLVPTEVTSVLVGHDAVARGVIGVPYEVKGEAVVRFVDLKLGTSASKSSLENPVAVKALAEGT